jgi:hypothetical protein
MAKAPEERRAGNVETAAHRLRIHFSAEARRKGRANLVGTAFAAAEDATGLASNCTLLKGEIVMGTINEASPYTGKAMFFAARYPLH